MQPVLPHGFMRTNFKYIIGFKMPPNGRYSIGTTVALINKKISRFHVPVNWAILLYGILVICFYFH
ncbi:uncharacterized protein LOC143038665 isoform X2 [Oratosquilla oratoria]|uniref:uncharacterized protein LOC143038665 isoform X2 n=1 Tax=Oratosquilla oratoria TaxID=337810 RepID=UPI003F77826A